MKRFTQGDLVELTNLSESQHTLIAEGFVHCGANLYHDTNFPDWKKFKYMGWDMNGDFRHSNSLHDFVVNGISTSITPFDIAFDVAVEVRPAKTKQDHEKQIARWLYTSYLGENFSYGNVEYIRVPGGWLIDGVFVPYNNEFHKPEYFHDNLALKTDPF